VLVPESIAAPWVWVAFTTFVVTLLVIDLTIFHRKPHVISIREAGLWTLGWVSLAATFNVLMFSWAGRDRGLEFTAGYLVELALSVDNMFVFALIFTLFAVPRAYQHRVLFWGILGALVMRFTFILLGSAMLNAFHWIIYVFGIFLIFTGVKILRQKEGAQIDPRKNIALRLFRRFVPMVPEYHGPRFTIMENGRRYATPMLAVLVMVEATDVVFAIDSVPAIFAITNDPFIVYSSNVFAILGLRSLYFLLAGMMEKFHYLKYGLGLVLVAIGAKMATSEFYHVPIGYSLAVIVLLIGGSVVISLLRPAPETAHAVDATPSEGILHEILEVAPEQPVQEVAEEALPDDREPEAFRDNGTTQPGARRVGAVDREQDGGN
jgi:tellurite resistance protein TerC